MTRLLNLPGLHRDEVSVMALIEICRQLTRSLDVNHVIGAIIEQTVTAISAADAAALFLYDQEPLAASTQMRWVRSGCGPGSQ